jgi:hypothetical protein
LDAEFFTEFLLGTVTEVEVLFSRATYQRAARLANSFDMPSLMRRMAVIGIPRHLMRWIAFPTPEACLAIPDSCGMPPYQMLVLNPVDAEFHF